jgi:hypothetical protein
VKCGVGFADTSLDPGFRVKTIIVDRSLYKDPNPRLILTRQEVKASTSRAELGKWQARSVVGFFSIKHVL